jgi:aminopeptidase N
MHRSLSTLLLGLSVLVTSCGESRQNKAASGTIQEPAIMDPHSHASASAARTTHLDLAITVDMDARTLYGSATYAVQPNGAANIVLDTDGLQVDSVQVDGRPVAHTLGDSTLIGKALTVPIDAVTKELTVHYRTGAEAKALQWLSPKQTADKAHPFLFTQGQAILTRTWIPIQDSPGIRMTYNATVKVPSELMAVMSASNPQARTADGVYSFAMEQPIPAYLMALAVGDISFAAIGERTGVYAERSVVEKAAWEFAEMERMLEAAEALYGPYRWGRYDVIVLPPSFPFGGMENPRLTFATPTIIAGDRSLTALIAHELAHSWSGNLVTNATWNDFWLNEGFTVYFENRIVEAIYGEERARMLQVLGRQELTNTLNALDEDGHAHDTHLRLDLAGRDPDEGMTDIAYEKGFAFLKMLESKAGRERFDAFLRGYFERHAFQSMTTDAFLAYLQDQLLTPAQVEVDLKRWVDGPGLPADALVPTYEGFTLVEQQMDAWLKGGGTAALNTAEWNTFQWMHFLRHLPADITTERLAELDKAYRLSESGNAEVLAAWLEQCVRHDHDPAFPALDRFLTNVGRRKFLMPLYGELMRSEKGKVLARTIYQQARPNYHSVAVRSLDELLAWKEQKPPASF